MAGGDFGCEIFEIAHFWCKRDFARGGLPGPDGGDSVEKPRGGRGRVVRVREAGAGADLPGPEECGWGETYPGVGKAAGCNLARDGKVRRLRPSYPAVKNVSTGCDRVTRP